MTPKPLFPELPIPQHYDPQRVGQVWQVPYQARAGQARQWQQDHNIAPAVDDRYKIALFGIDIQNTFCIPGFELFVGGRSGTGAVEDNQRLTAFMYRNLASLNQITMTMDTHYATQIFHDIFLVDAHGQHPPAMTLVSAADVALGHWKFNPEIAPYLGLTPEQGQEFLRHYTRTLQERSKYDLTVWPYHAMLGGIGHALVPAVEEAVFFHTIARNSQAQIEIKGDNPLTESYSAIGPEVTTTPDGRPIDRKNEPLVEKLLRFDAVIIAGQAKSHCVAWTISDLLDEIRTQDPGLARKLYLLEDCSSPVVVPDVVDYTDEADAAYVRFAEAGAHIVRSTAPLSEWPGLG